MDYSTIILIWKLAIAHWNELQLSVAVEKQPLLLYIGDRAAYENGDRPTAPTLEGLTPEQAADIELLVEQAILEQPLGFGGTIRYALVESGIVKGFVSVASGNMLEVPGFDVVPTYPGQNVGLEYSYDAQTSIFTAPEPEQVRLQRFYKANQVLMLDLLDASPRQTTASLLSDEFRSSPVDWSDMVLYWNRAIAPIPPTPDQIATLNASAATYRLPVQLTAEGVMTLV